MIHSKLGMGISVTLCCNMGFASLEVLVLYSYATHPLFAPTHTDTLFQATMGNTMEASNAKDSIK